MAGKQIEDFAEKGNVSGDDIVLIEDTTTKKCFCVKLKNIIPYRSISEDKLAVDAVTNRTIMNNAVDTQNIRNRAVTQAKIKEKSIVAGHIQDGNITADKIANGAIQPIHLSTWIPRTYRGVSAPNGGKPGDIWINIEENMVYINTGGHWCRLVFDA